MMETSRFPPERLEELSKSVQGADKVTRKADDFPEARDAPDSKLSPVFPGPENNIWTVKGYFPMIPYVLWLPVTMTIYKNVSTGALTLFNAFRTREVIEKEILELGRVENIVKLGQFHGDADAYYLRASQFGGPKYWTLPDASVAEGVTPDHTLSSANVPVKGSVLYQLKWHPFPESVITLPCGPNGTMLVTCDSLIYLRDTVGVPVLGRIAMNLFGFIAAEGAPQPAPVWIRKTLQLFGAEPVRGWFEDIANLEWRGIICGHGDPLTDCDHAAVMDAVNKRIGNL